MTSARRALRSVPDEPATLRIPANEAAERAVLGAILADAACFDRVAAMINTDDFYSDANRLVFEAFRVLAETGVPIDLLTTTDQLERSGMLKAAGGVAYVASLAEGLPDPANVEHYATIIRSCARKRRLLRLGQDVIAAVASDNGTGDAALRSLEAELRETQTNSSPRSAVDLITAADLAETAFVEPRWAVPGLIPEGAVILAGPPKVGKSWLALAVAYAVAAGGHVLGEIHVEAGEAIYFGLEDTRRRLRSRLDLIREGAPAPAGLHLATALPRLDAGGLDVLDSTLTAHPGTRLLVIDTLARIRPDRKRGGDLYQEDAALVASLQRLAVAHRIALVIVTHTRKTSKVDADALETVSGTLGLTGAADAVLVLRRGRLTATGLLNVTGRDLEERQLALRFDATAGAWVLLGEAAEVRRSEEQRSILDLFAARREGLTIREVSLELGRKYDNVKFLILKLLQAGKLVRFGPGSYALPTTSPASSTSFTSSTSLPKVGREVKEVDGVGGPLPSKERAHNRKIGEEGSGGSGGSGGVQ